jgi:hypothetical protein
LTLSDIKGMHFAGALLKQTVRESACRGAQIRAYAAGNGNVKVIERGLQFDACPADKWQLMQHAYLGIGIDQLTGLLCFLLVNEDLSGQKQCLRFMAAFRKAALYKQLIDTPFHRIMPSD